jgi:hypothetical protein
MSTPLTCTHTHTNAHTHTHTHNHTHTRTHTHTHTHTQMHTHTNAHTHTITHSLTHSHTQTLKRAVRWQNHLPTRSDRSATFSFALFRGLVPIVRSMLRGFVPSALLSWRVCTACCASSSSCNLSRASHAQSAHLTPQTLSRPMLSRTHARGRTRGRTHTRTQRHAHTRTRTRAGTRSFS